MVRHIVLWKLKEFAEGATREENARRMKEALEALSTQIPEVRRVEVGLDFNRSESAFDVALVAEFDSRDDLAAYREHGDHLKAAEFIQKVREERVVVDYETD
jgi:hypothetical protein